MDATSAGRRGAVCAVGQPVIDDPTIHKTFIVAFTPDSYEGAPSVFRGLEGSFFRINGTVDAQILATESDGLRCQTVARDWDDDSRFISTEFHVPWDDIDSLLYW